MPKPVNPINIRTGIGLIGYPGSGKTTLLTVLSLAMKQLGWKFNWLDDFSHTQTLLSLNQMIQNGIYPRSTSASKREIFRFRTQPPASNNLLTRLIKRHPNPYCFDVEIMDVAGQTLLLGDEFRDEQDITSIVASDSLIFVIDPMWENYYSHGLSFGIMLADILGLVQHHRVQRRIFVAFCVTKMDQFPDVWFDVEAFVREVIFKNQNTILAQLDNFCDVTDNVFCRWFPCSSVGFIEGIRSRDFEQENGERRIRDSGNLTPMGIGEALEWLLLRGDTPSQSRNNKQQFMVPRTGLKGKEQRSEDFDMSRVSDIENLISINERRLQKLKEQKALYGISTDPKITIEIEDIEAKLVGLQNQSNIFDMPSVEKPIVSDSPKVFISYSRQDQTKVEHIYKVILSNNFQPWMDIKDILPGEDWKRSIKSAIRNADFFVVCLSQNLVSKRGFLQVEIREALEIWKEKLEDDIYLIPVRLDECKVPESLEHLQWVDIFVEGGIARLVNALEIGAQRL